MARIDDHLQRFPRVQEPLFMIEAVAVTAASSFFFFFFQVLVGEIYSFPCNETLCIPYGLHEFM